MEQRTYDIRINEEQRRILLQAIAFMIDETKSVTEQGLLIGMLQRLPDDSEKNPGSVHDFTA